MHRTNPVKLPSAWLLLAALAVLASACTTSPLGRRQLVVLPEHQVDAMGVSAYADIKRRTPMSEDIMMRRRVLCVADSIAREVGGQWEVSLFVGDSVNAFALPGNKIGVYEGIFKVARTQDQLAAVIGHELAHVIAKHPNERVSTTYAAQGALHAIGASGAVDQQTMGMLGVGVQYGVLMPYGRTQESEADLVGLDLMARAGFDPRASIELWKNMDEIRSGAPPEFMSTHPSSDTRISGLAGRLAHALALYNAALERGKRPDCF